MHTCSFAMRLQLLSRERCNATSTNVLPSACMHAALCGVKRCNATCVLAMQLAYLRTCVLEWGVGSWRMVERGWEGWKGGDPSMVRAMILQFVAALAMLRMYFLGTWCTGVVRHRRQLELSFVAQMSCGQLPPLTAVPLRAQFETDSTAKRRRWQPSRKRANFSPQRTLCLPEKTQCLVQILTFKSHPWCSSSNAICQQRLANHNQNRNFSALLFSSLVFSTLPVLYP